VAVVAVSLLATLAFAILTLRSRPLENTEGCLLFEASRIRAGLALYTDPVVGARDYGAVPARYLVLYPPLWSRVLSFFPDGSDAWLGRSFGAFAWYGTLAWIAWGAHRRGRPVGVLVAAFVGSVYTLALYGASARPDSVAVALSALALERSVRAGRSGAVEGGLFALAAWVKPNVVGLGLGSLMSQLAAPLRFLGGWGGVSALVLWVLHRASGGLWWAHLRAATVQPLSLTLWTEQMTTRVPFFVLPVAFALYAGIAGRADPGVRLATLALGASVVWTLASLAKVGSATCYFMEPCVGALVVCAHAPVPRLSTRAEAAVLLAAPLQALWTGVASVASSVESILESPAQERVLARIRGELSPRTLVLSDDAGIELTLDRRLIDTPFQTTALARAGRFPDPVWISDVVMPEIVGLVATSDVLERPLAAVDPVHDRYDASLRRALRERFVLGRREAGFYVYARRGSP
jgi:hypothetical protein